MLYNDFRPQNFNDMIGQDHITKILKNQIKSGQVSHAYLLCGTRGTGKTTSAKIIAKAVNCLSPVDGEPCGECEMCRKIQQGTCPDIMELDAASNNGVEDIRGIISSLMYPPVEAKYKVYILDEVHMLSMGAVNAFLKTLEEPPKNVIFILATTDPQKLPVTILSRCQKFDFRRIRTDDIFTRLKYVSSKAHINIEGKGLNLIAKVSDGAMRDALSILEQSMSLDTGNGVIYKDLLNLLGISNNNNLFRITENVLKDNKIEALNIIASLDEQGIDLLLLTKDLIKFLRNLLMVKTMKENASKVVPMAEEDIEKLKIIGKDTSSEKIISLIKVLQNCELKMKTSSQIRVVLELGLIEYGSYNASGSINTMRSDIKQLEDEMKKLINRLNCNQKINTSASDIKIKIKESKENIIAALKASPKVNIKQIGEALEKTKLKVSVFPKIIIISENKEEKLILNNGIECIRRGFSKFLNQPEEKVEITIV
ncbi:MULTISPECIES: DNA polymerase III subunit gamma/tau [Clostridium]|uniref:DNA polymerase III subunit gamma/tau n=1 Tax=Clostridium TaxID=1485 RepID=UPI000825AD85|nr:MULTISPECIES: DNA polymerase III subunit gamma/tau [Clostridium]PJI10232.1 DNA polymerase III subunit gamma/tau [Clostridium sp. CT7]